MQAGERKRRKHFWKLVIGQWLQAPFDYSGSLTRLQRFRVVTVRAVCGSGGPIRSSKEWKALPADPKANQLTYQIVNNDLLI